ncbi:tetraspanin-1 isoform X1 [Astyanax mexicanus]|uniref:tetraspanin-1 isoform X1 n=1 Tax=Astyanax mexicanus TaxID=7994 RepID=UPI0020CB4C9D|nr:tetraspanin-1 isoform X1 [Astyanax mexicanus]
MPLMKLYHQQHLSLMRKTMRKKKTWKKLHPLVPWPQHQHTLSLHYISALVLPQHKQLSLMRKTTWEKKIWEELHPVVPWIQHQHKLHLHHISALVIPLQHKLAGGVSVCVGVLVEVNSKYLRTVLDHIKDSPPELAQLGNVGFLLIAVGIILAFMGFLGCCGALCDNKCMLMTFFITVLIVFLAEVAGAVLILLFQPMAEKLLTGIRGKVAKSIQSSYGENEVFTTAWNETMNLMQCCGYNNYTDFTNSPFMKQTTQYPNNCCHQKDAQCTKTAAIKENTPGCFSAVVKLVEENSVLMAGVAICIAAIEVCAMTVSVLLYKN